LDLDAVSCLTIACSIAKKIYPQVILIAEDVSGFPSLCRSYEEGGVGFNYRLAMAVPDMWIRLLKDCKDEDWDMEKIVH
jgi:1,4-alpha-glucan branching enzyme